MVSLARTGTPKCRAAARASCVLPVPGRPVMRITKGRSRACNGDTCGSGNLPRMKPEKRTVQYRGRIITLSTDEVILPNGNRAELEVVHHPGGAAAVAIDSQMR